MIRLLEDAHPNVYSVLPAQAAYLKAMLLESPMHFGVKITLLTESSLPTLAIPDWSVLQLPEPEPGIALERFRTKWLSPCNNLIQKWRDSALQGRHRFMSPFDPGYFYRDHLDVEGRIWQVGKTIISLSKNKNP